jgi:hypothetical protein
MIITAVPDAALRRETWVPLTAVAMTTNLRRGIVWLMFRAERVAFWRHTKAV